MASSDANGTAFERDCRDCGLRRDRPARARAAASCSSSLRRSCSSSARGQQPALRVGDLPRELRRAASPIGIHRPRHACLGKILEQHSRPQTLTDLDRLGEPRWLRLQQPAGEPVVIARPVAEQRRSTAVVFLAGSQPLDRIEGLERLGDRLVFVQRAPDQSKPRLPRIGQQRAPTVGADQGDRLAAQLLGAQGIARRLVKRQRPQAGGAQVDMTQPGFQVQAAAQVNPGPVRDRVSATGRRAPGALRPRLVVVSEPSASARTASASATSLVRAPGRGRASLIVSRVLSRL